MSLQARFSEIRNEWTQIRRRPSPNVDRFDAVKREAEAIIDAGRWVSGPADLLSVLDRQRDELVHSRLIAWLLTPTGRHGLGRRFLTALLDQVWPAESLMATGLVSVQTEWTRSAADELGSLREARADIVVTGEDATLIIENKVDAGEGLDQCERLYWSWADQPAETRWLFLSPTGRAPVTASSPAAISAWRTLSYAELRRLLATTLQAVGAGGDQVARSTALQYLESISSLVPR